MAGIARASARRVGSFALLSIFVAGCGAERSKTAEMQQRQGPAPIAPAPVIAGQWVHRKPGGRSPQDRTGAIAESSIRQVAPSDVDRAIRELVDSPWKVLSKDEAIALADQPFASGALESGMPVLLRCVENDHSSNPEDRRIERDHFRVYFANGVVEVVCSGGRFEDFPDHPQPIIAVLPYAPTDLFVSPNFTIGLHARDMPNATGR
jgi:hypothetical protein